MNVIYALIILLLTSTFSYAEPFYFSPQNKKTGLDYYKKIIYNGCSSLKALQEPIPQEEMKKYVQQVRKLVNEDYSRAFKENPLVKIAWEKDMETLLKDSNCQRPGNDCRVRLITVSLFYYQRLRPDIPGCQNYVSGKSPMNSQCEVELKFRSKDLRSVPKNYGAYGIGTYKDELTVIKNNTTLRTFQTVMYKDKSNLHICQEDSRYKYGLNINDPGLYYEGLNPEDDPARRIPSDCMEDKMVLEQKFIPTDFEDRSSVGEDQVDPLKKYIEDYIKNNPETIVTELEVTASSSKVPFYIMKDGKKVIDPDSQKKNAKLAQERAFFAKKVLEKMKGARSDYSKIEMSFKATLAGPDFKPTDLNERFVTRMTPGYLERIESLYKNHEKEYQNKALKAAAYELLDADKFTNMYQAKFKPFQGFKLTISGYKKEFMKCTEKAFKNKKSGSATKQ